jgi:hypothetical protein
MEFVSFRLHQFCRQDHCGAKDQRRDKNRGSNLMVAVSAPLKRRSLHWGVSLRKLRPVLIGRVPSESPQVWRECLSDSTALKKLEEQHDDRDDQQQMNQVSDDAKAETERPKNQDN